MNWKYETFGREVCNAAHKWANRALAVPLVDGDVVMAEVCTRCGIIRCARKAGIGMVGAGSKGGPS